MITLVTGADLYYNQIRALLLKMGMFEIHMRILIVCQHFWPENFRINDICKDLLDAGYDVDVLCGIPNYPKGVFFKGYHYWGPRHEKFGEARVMRVGEIPQTKKLGSLSIIMNYYFFPFASIFHIPALLAKKYDLVFMYSLTPVFMSFPGIVLSRLKKIPSLMYILDYWPDSLFSVIKIRSKLLRKHFARVSKWHYKRADRILTPSRGMKEKLTSDLAISPDKIAFVPQACEGFYEKKEYSRELHERFDGKFNFVFAGNIGPAQALTSLADAAAILRESESEPCCRFILVGDGMSKSALVQHIEKLGVTDYFVFEGYKPSEKMMEYHELADALYASLGEDPLFSIMIPAKVQSYMAAGKPVLASMSGEGARIIEENGCGLTCPTGDSAGLARRVREFVGIPEEKRLEMGRAGYEYYYSNYRSDIIKNQLIKEIEYCMKSHTAK